MSNNMLKNNIKTIKLFNNIQSIESYLLIICYDTKI